MSPLRIGKGNDILIGVVEATEIVSVIKTVIQTLSGSGGMESVVTEIVTRVQGGKTIVTNAPVTTTVQNLITSTIVAGSGNDQTGVSATASIAATSAGGAKSSAAVTRQQESGQGSTTATREGGKATESLIGNGKGGGQATGTGW